MGLGIFHPPGAGRIWVGTTSPANVLIGGAKTGNYAIARQTTVDDFLNGQASDTSVGKASRRWTVTGVASTGDDGLLIVKASIDDDVGDPIFMAGSIDGTNGEGLAVRCSNLELGWAANAKVTFSFTAEQAGDPAALAAGGILDAA